MTVENKSDVGVELPATSCVVKIPDVGKSLSDLESDSSQGTMYSLDGFALPFVVPNDPVFLQAVGDLVASLKNHEQASSGPAATFSIGHSGLKGICRLLVCDGATLYKIRNENGDVGYEPLGLSSQSTQMEVLKKAIEQTVCVVANETSLIGCVALSKYRTVSVFDDVPIRFLEEHVGICNLVIDQCKEERLANIRVMANRGFPICSSLFVCFYNSESGVPWLILNLLKTSGFFTSEDEVRALFTAQACRDFFALLLRRREQECIASNVKSSDELPMAAGGTGELTPPSAKSSEPTPVSESKSICAEVKPSATASSWLRAYGVAWNLQLIAEQPLPFAEFVDNNLVFRQINPVDFLFVIQEVESIRAKARGKDDFLGFVRFLFDRFALRD